MTDLGSFICVVEMVALKIGFIGAGIIAHAMAKGFIAAGITTANQVMASSPKSDKKLLDQMQALGCNVTFDNREVTSYCDVLVIAVKPVVVTQVLTDIINVLTPAKPLVTSVALGVTLETLERATVAGTRVIRVMTNTPALVGFGTTVISRGASATKQDVEITRRLFSSVGDCTEVPESYLDAVTGLSGSGPAYMYLTMEAMADGGVLMGLPRPLAQKLAAQTMMGAAKMVLETGKHPGELKDQVCSPGGCTIDGVRSLEIRGIRAAFIEAVKTATEKSVMISKGIE